jgi:hypothetical protein
MGSVTLHELYFGSLGGDGAVLFTGSGAGTKLATPCRRHSRSPGSMRRPFGVDERS